jgi:CHASE1-domain containing sensor protein
MTETTIHVPRPWPRLQRYLHRIGVAEASLAVALMLTAVGWYVARHTIVQNVHERFESDTNDVRDKINARLQRQNAILHSGVALFNIVGNVNRGQWRHFSEQLTLTQLFPGTQGIGYSQVILPADKDSHIAKVRAEGFPDYTIRPSGERPLYTSIVYLEPFQDRNLSAFGFDMFSETVRRRAMERARDTGNSSMSGPVRLVQEIRGPVQRGFLLYVPVYRDGLVPPTAQERAAKLLGYVYSPFRMQDWMESILNATNRLLALDIFDNETDPNGAMLSDAHLLDSTAMRNGAPLTGADLHKTLTLEIAGRVWRLDFKAKMSTLAPQILIIPPLFAFAGIIISIP